MREVRAYVDGGCHPNPGRGGWGVLLSCESQGSASHEKRLSGVVPEAGTTNQRAEIYAAIRALSALKMPCRVLLFSDSQYLIKSMLGDFSRRTNLDLWEELDTAVAQHEIEWIWMRGHAGARGNEIAHVLAERAIESLLVDHG